MKVELAATIIPGICYHLVGQLSNFFKKFQVLGIEQQQTHTEYTVVREYGVNKEL